MNNGVFSSLGGNGQAKHTQVRHNDGVNNDSYSHSSIFHPDQTQMNDLGFGGSPVYRSQFPDQAHPEDVTLLSSSEDDRGCEGQTAAFDASEFQPHFQYHGQGYYGPQHNRGYPGGAPNKPSMSVHSVHQMTSAVGQLGHSSSSFPTNPRMHSLPNHSYPGQQMPPSLNHMLQASSPGMPQKVSPVPGSLTSSREHDEGNSIPSYLPKSEMASPSLPSYSVPPHLHQQPWGPHLRAGGHYPYSQGPHPSQYRIQPGGSDMSQGRRPGMGAPGGAPYPQQGGQYMGQQMPVGPSGQRFMMGGPMSSMMYGHPSNQPPHMYMPSSQLPPGPPISPAARPPTPQQSQQMQNVLNSPSQSSPAPSDHGSAQDANNPDDPGGENSRGSAGLLRPAPSPVGSTGSRSNTPASVTGTQAGSPMPVRPSGQIDGVSRTTQSPMAPQGYGPHMMPPPNNMGYMSTPGKLSAGQMQGHYLPYGSQFSQGSYTRQQPGMGVMSGPAMTGSVPSYPGSQPLYPNGPSQMAAGGMYGNMPGMRSMGQPMYGGSQGPPYTQANVSMGSAPCGAYGSYPGSGQHGAQQHPASLGGGSVPASISAQQQANLATPPHHGSSNKAAQAAQAAMMAAAGSRGPPHSRGSSSPSRGMFGHIGVGSQGPGNNIISSPNLGSPSLNSMSNAVDQLSRSMSSPFAGSITSSAASPVPKSVHSPAVATGMNASSGGAVAHHASDHHIAQASPISNADTQDSLSRPNSTLAHPADLPNNESTTGSDSSGGIPSDSTSVDSGFHSSDPGDKMSTASPPPPVVPPREGASRTIENISPPSYPNYSHHAAAHHMQIHHHQQHYQPDPDCKMPYSNDSIAPLPLSAMSLMPSSSSGVITTVSAGPMVTSVTQSISSPVTSVSTSIPHHYPHSQHMGSMGPPHSVGHMMGPGPHGMMPNGLPSGSAHPGYMGLPNQMPHPLGAASNQLAPHMAGPHHMNPSLGGPNLNMSHNGPSMGPSRFGMPTNGPMMMSAHPGMSLSSNSSSSQTPMGHMPSQQQQQQHPQMNCMPHVGGSSNSAISDEPPEKKKKTKKSNSDLSRLFDMGPEPDRRPFLERVLAFLEETGQPVTALPVISKTPLDLYKLYLCVQEKGGFEEVTRSKKWRDICTVVNIGTSASAAFTLKKNYIRYLLNFECKYDRGGINPAPILAQMEAQLAHKREQKSRQRAPSPGSNSNESFQQSSATNNSMDSPFQPSNMPPQAYMQNQDGSLPNPTHMGANMKMGPGSMGPGLPMSIGAVPPGAANSGPMNHFMGVSQGVGFSNMMGGPASSMMHGQCADEMSTSPHLGPAPSAAMSGYGGQPAQPPANSSSDASQPTSRPIPFTSDSISVRDPFADDSSYLHYQHRRVPFQPTFPPQLLPPPPTSTALGSTFPGGQPSGNGSANLPGPPSRPGSAVSGYGGSNQHLGGGMSPNCSSPLHPSSSSSQDQFPCGPQFHGSDRPEPGGPEMSLKQSAAPTQHTPTLPPSEHGTPAYPNPSFPPSQPTAGLRPEATDSPGLDPQQGFLNKTGSFPASQYPHFPHNNTPGPRPAASSSGFFGSPGKQFPEDHPGSQMSDWSNSSTGSHYLPPATPPDQHALPQDDRIRDGQWSPMPQQQQPPRMASGYISPAPPSTPPPLVPYSRQISHRSSPQIKEVTRITGQKVPPPPPPTCGVLSSAPLTRKEVTFPPDCVESVKISTAKRKKLTSKDIAPFEAWRLMLSLKSGLLAESSWALDTLNILLHDDSTSLYFGLNSLPGLLEVLAEHYRRCLIQMFPEFQQLEYFARRRKGSNPEGLDSSQEEFSKKLQKVIPEVKEEVLTVNLSGPNYTFVSRKGLPVKIENNPPDTSVTESKEWDVFSGFDLKPDHWLEGCGDLTDHIHTHLESDNSNTFLSRTFRRKRSKIDSCESVADVCQSKVINHAQDSKTPKSPSDFNVLTCTGNICNKVKQEETTSGSVSATDDSTRSDAATDKPCAHSEQEESERVNHSIQGCDSSTCDGQKSQLPNSDQVPVEDKQDPEPQKDPLDSNDTKDAVSENELKGVANCDVISNDSRSEDTCANNNSKVKLSDTQEENGVHSSVVENGDIDEPQLSPIASHIDSNDSVRVVDKSVKTTDSEPLKAGDAENDNCSNSSPPILKAECMESDEENGLLNQSVVNKSVHETSSETKSKSNKTKGNATSQSQNKVNMSDREKTRSCRSEEDAAATVTDSLMSQTAELSAQVVHELMKQCESVEDEAFQRDDPPLCLNLEGRDELGRRCVCISNIIRSLSNVPDNEAHISRHVGIMRILGRLLLLHHSHQEKPPPRTLHYDVEEEEREEPPRVYDEEHWWWPHLDQLRENTLVTLANICGHLQLGDYSEQVCHPLLEGLLHWVICPASVARDPLSTLPAGSLLSPQRLVLEALCKLCINETNVDLLLATRPYRRLLELFNVLVHLLADRSHQITREFAIVLLSLLVTAESSAARAIALQHPSVSLLVDFLEVAEQNALTIVNQQGIEIVQSNPELMGTSLDMLRRAAMILLQIARIPDNRQMFLRQQTRLLNLVMSQILDPSISDTLAEVLYECSQLS